MMTEHRNVNKLNYLRQTNPKPRHEEKLKF